MEEEKLARIIATAVDTSLEKKLGSFFIEREQHYQDHVFVKDVREGTDKLRGMACSAVAKAGITGIVVLLGYGFWEWIKRGIGMK